MDLTVKRSGLELCEKVFEYSMPVEQAAESVVPDTQPDVERILFAAGTALLSAKEPREGAISLAGSVEASVLYVPEGGAGLCTLAVSVPVSVELDAPGVTAESLTAASLGVAAVDARALNPRKVLVRCTVNVCAEAYAASVLELGCGIGGEDAGAVETLTEQYTVTPVVSVCERTCVVSDEYRLQPGLLPIGRLLWHGVELCGVGARAVGSRLVVSGTARLAAVYEAAESSETASVSFETEFSQMLDAGTELVNPCVTVIAAPTAEYIETVTLAAGEKGISAEVHMALQCVVSDDRRCECLADCYSNVCEIDVTRGELKTDFNRRAATLRAAINETIAASPMPVSIVRALCTAGPAECEDGRLRCAVTATVLYTASDGGVYAVQRRISAETSASLAEGERAECVRACCAACTAGIAQGGVDFRAQVDFSFTALRRGAIGEICAVECSEAAEAAGRPSVTVVRAGGTDSLWILAKRCHSTTAAIAEQNELDPSAPIAGRVLLIPAVRQ